MWKDFFYFTKAERRAILVLLILLALLSGGSIWFRLKKQDMTPLSLSESERIDSFLTGLEEKKRFPKKSFSSYHKEPAVPVRLRPFDPNTADSSTLRTLGLPAFIAQNVIKYREKGGIFHTPEDFSRMYGLSPAQFETLKPYIIIGENFLKPERDTMRHTVFVRDTLPYLPKYPEGTVIDLNQADTASLKRVPGIGSGLARRIVAYRNRLGGFYSVSQLQEIPHLDAKVNQWFKVEPAELRKLEINRASLDRLRSHPYMDFYKAKAIIEYRRKRGKLKSLSQLSLFEAFSEEDIKKITPYLSFE